MKYNFKSSNFSYRQPHQPNPIFLQPHPPPTSSTTNPTHPTNLSHSNRTHLGDIRTPGRLLVEIGCHKIDDQRSRVSVVDNDSEQEVVVFRV